MEITKITGNLIAESDPRSTHQWHFTPEAAKKLAKDAVGLPVTINYDPTRVVGRVASAEYLEDGSIAITVETTPGSDVGALASGLEFGPGFVIDEERDGAVQKATPREISVINRPPTPDEN